MPAALVGGERTGRSGREGKEGKVRSCSWGWGGGTGGVPLASILRTTVGWHHSPGRPGHRPLPTFPLPGGGPHLSDLNPVSPQKILFITETIPDLRIQWRAGCHPCPERPEFSLSLPPQGCFEPPSSSGGLPRNLPLQLHVPLLTPFSYSFLGESLPFLPSHLLHFSLLSSFVRCELRRLTSALLITPILLFSLA